MPTTNKEIKKAYKTFKFWTKVLLTTDLLNQKEDRIELLEALKLLKQEFNAKSGL